MAAPIAFHGVLFADSSYFRRPYRWWNFQRRGTLVLDGGALAFRSRKFRLDLKDETALEVERPPPPRLNVALLGIWAVAIVVLQITPYRLDPVLLGVLAVSIATAIWAWSVPWLQVTYMDADGRLAKACFAYGRVRFLFGGGSALHRRLSPLIQETGNAPTAEPYAPRR